MEASDQLNFISISFAQLVSDNMKDAVIVTLCEFLDCYLTCPKCLRQEKKRCNYHETKVIVPNTIIDEMKDYLPPELQMPSVAKKSRSKKSLPDAMYEEMAKLHRDRCMEDYDVQP